MERSDNIPPLADFAYSANQDKSNNKTILFVSEKSFMYSNVELQLLSLIEDIFDKPTCHSKE
jgi:hypothetical protein